VRAYGHRLKYDWPSVHGRSIWELRIFQLVTLKQDVENEMSCIPHIVAVKWRYIGVPANSLQLARNERCIIFVIYREESKNTFVSVPK
jgi:hypothetical protein